MGKLLWCEWAKLKRRPLFQIAALTSVVLPILFLPYLKSQGTDADATDAMMDVLRTESGFLLLIPLLVILASNLLFEEHDNDTLKNLVCVPISKGRLVVAKLGLLLLFSLAYLMVGYLFGVLALTLAGWKVDGWLFQLWLTAGTGVLLWAAALPCVLLAVWLNKSSIITVVLAFFYTMANYILGISSNMMMMPMGLNAGTLLPVPLLKRWLFQYHVMRPGSEGAQLYAQLSPYFVTPAQAFAVLGAEAAVCLLLIVWVYRRQEN